MTDLRDKVTMLRYSFISGSMPDECMFYFQLQNILFEIIDRLEKLEKMHGSKNAASQEIPQQAQEGDKEKEC